MSAAHVEYIAAGGNRHPSAADWDSDVLAYGTGNNVAIWNPQVPDNRGVKSLLSGHTDTVNAVKLFKDRHLGQQIIITASADQTIRIWLERTESPGSYLQAKCLTEHKGSVNAIAVLPESDLFITGAADATVKIWRFKTENNEVSHLTPYPCPKLTIFSGTNCSRG